MTGTQLQSKLQNHDSSVSLTHGGREDDNAEHVHLLTAARTRLVHDLRGRSQLQVHCAPIGVAVIRDNVDKVGCDGSGRDFEDGDQVGFVLQGDSRLITGSQKAKQEI